MKTIAPAELQALLAAQPGLPLLDVRTPVEYAEMHVPQARNVPLDTLAPRELFDAGGLTKGQPIYILCRTGGRASKAAEKSINDGLRQDLLGTPVRVTSVDPGMVETDFSLVRFRGDSERAAKVYKGVTPLTPEDVADTIVWAVKRPAHVNIARVVMTSVDQANSLLFNREA